MAILYKQSGKIEHVQPKNGKHFTREELYEMLECDTVERIFIKGIRVIVIVNEAGKLRQRPLNKAATMVYHRCRRMGDCDWIAGDALVCYTEQF